MEIVNSIKKHREDLEISQKELADMVGVTRMIVIKWENNDYMPSFRNTLQLMKVFNCSFEDLFEEVEK